MSSVNSAKTTLIISPEPWGQNLLSKHHYALFLAESNPVLFLNPASGYAKFPFGDMQIESETVSANLNVINYRNLVPKLNHWPLFLRRRIYRIQAKRILSKLNVKPCLVWSFDPRRFYDQRVWGAEKCIYHSVDLHPNSNEKLVCESSDLVVALSDLIAKNLSQYSGKLLQTGHGSHVDTNSVLPKNLPGSNSVKAIYTGNFHKHVDYALLNQLAQENREVDFCLIGPTKPNNLSSATLDQKDLDLLLAQPNIYLMGSVDGNELIHYLAAADICLVLFKKEFEIIHHSPHKMMAYFASGKVILANPMSAYQNSNDSLLTQCEQTDIPEKFRLIKEHLSEFNSAEKIAARKKYADQNHYRTKIKLILSNL